MWRSRAQSLLSRLPRQRSIRSQLQVQHPKTVGSPPLPLGPRSILTRFLSSDPIPTSIQFDQQSVPDLENLEKPAPFDSWSSVDGDSHVDSSVFDYSGSNVDKGEAFDEGRGNLVFPEDGHDESGAFDVEVGKGEAEFGVDEFDPEKAEAALSVLRSDEAESVGSRLEDVGVVLSEEFVAGVLRDSDVPIANLCRFFDWAIKRSDFVKNRMIVDLLVERAMESSELTVEGVLMLWDLVKEFAEGDKEIVGVKNLNRLIELFLKHRRGKPPLLEVYEKFEDMGCVPDEDTYYLMILALGPLGLGDKTLEVCKKMVDTKRIPDGDKVGKIIEILCKRRNAMDAHTVYLAAKAEDKTPAPFYLDMLVDHLSRKDDTLHLAMDLLGEYAGRVDKSYRKSIHCIISGLCRKKDTMKAKELLERMLISGPAPLKVSFNYVIAALSKAGDTVDAISLLNSMRNKQLKPDMCAYNAIMSAFARAGLMNEALDIFSQAKVDHQKLGRVSYHIISRGYCRINDYENAIRWMNEMKVEGISPNVDDYGKMIRTLCLDAVDLKTSAELLKEMETGGLPLDVQTRAIVAAIKELEEEEIQFLEEKQEA